MDGNYDLFTPGINGFTTGPSISDSMLDPDQALYGRGTTPIFPQTSQHVGYNHQYAQEVFSLKERCKALESQLVKVTTERDTMRTMLNQLSASLQNQNTAMAPPPPVMTAQMYPKVRFWTQKSFNEWTNSAEAHADRRYKLAFVEDEQGTVVSDTTLKAIRKKIRGCWVELVDKNMAPKSWGKATTSAKELVHTVVYKAYSFLQLADNDWKLELLCSGDYPGWVRNNLDAQGKWQVKQEDDITPGQESLSGTSKKRKAKTGSKAEGSEKRMKSDLQESQAASFSFDNSLVDTPACKTPPKSPLLMEPISHATAESAHSSRSLDSVTMSTNPSPASPNMVHTLVDPSHSSPTDTILTSTGTNPSRAPPDTFATLMTDSSHSTPSKAVFTSTNLSLATSLTNPFRASLDIALTLTDPSHVSSTDVIPTSTNVSSASLNAEPKSALPSTDSNRDTAQVPEPVDVNPVTSLCKKSLKIKIPPLPPLPLSIANKQNISQGKNEGEQDTVTSLFGKRKGTTSRKMRPTKNRTGYNLCAIRWLAQVNENGTSEEFRTYWHQDLDEFQREAYKNEAKDLVEKNAWNDGVSAGVLH